MVDEDKSPENSEEYGTPKNGVSTGLNGKSPFPGTEDDILRFDSQAWQGAFRALSKIEDAQERQRISGRWTECLLERTSKGINLSGTNLSQLNLSYCNLKKANLTRTNLSSTNLSSANLESATIMCPMSERLNLKGANLQGLYAHALGAQIVNLTQANLDHALDMTGSLFHGVKLKRASLKGAVLNGSLFYQCDLSHAQFTGARLVGCSFNECVLNSADYSHAHLDDAVFLKSAMDEVSFDSACSEGLNIQKMQNIRGASFRNANFISTRVLQVSFDQCEFGTANLSALDLVNVSLNECRFERANLAYSRFLRVRGTNNSFEGANFSSATILSSVLPQSCFDAVSAENMHIVESSLRDSSFSKGLKNKEGSQSFAARCLSVRDSDLSACNFAGAYLYRSFFTGDPIPNMRLDQCSFEGANLIQGYLAASLRGANMRNVKGAYLRLNQSDLSAADLRGAELFESSCVKTTMEDADLRGVTAPLWLDRCPGWETTQCDEGLKNWESDLGALMKRQKRGST